MPYYMNPSIVGIISAASEGNGTEITIKYPTAYSKLSTNKIAYNIYMSLVSDYSIPNELFKEDPKFVSLSGNKILIPNLTPGELYFFGIRAIEYSDLEYPLTTLPTINGIHYYPQTLLSQNLNDTQLDVHVIDASLFPNFGVLQIGVELIKYTSVDRVNNIIHGIERGYQNSKASIHNTNGFDGTTLYYPTVYFFKGHEEKNTKVIQCQSRFEYDNLQNITPDGYHQKNREVLFEDLSNADEENKNFPMYDYASYHQADPVSLLNGECVGSYIGGEMFCQDDETGVGRVVRGFSLQDQNMQRQEMLLSVTGRKVVFLKRIHFGITCPCLTPKSDHADDRCPKCYGTGYVVGWEQYFNSRRSDGRLLVRFGSFDEDIKTTEQGWDSEVPTECWTLTVPTLRDRDVLVLYDNYENEVFRYEILKVNRNNTINGLQGAQKFSVQRIRKTDPIYQIKVIKDTSLFPRIIQTGISSEPNVPAHQHTFRVNEKITNINQINQLTSLVSGHTHIIENGQMLLKGVNHTHTISL